MNSALWMTLFILSIPFILKKVTITRIAMFAMMTRMKTMMLFIVLVILICLTFRLLLFPLMTSSPSPLLLPLPRALLKQTRNFLLVSTRSYVNKFATPPSSPPEVFFL